MGFSYKAARQEYKLIFADEAMHGLEVVVTKLPLGLVLRMRELSAAGPEVSGGPAAMRELIEGLIGSMLSWNMEDETGRPVPLTVESILTLDEDFVQQILSSWTLALGGISAPLGGGSTSGASLVEASMPMEPLSPSPSS